MWTCVLVCFAPCAVLFTGCADRANVTGTTSNEAPTVRITGGPSEGTTADYRAEMFWSATDSDGRVSHVLVAIDDDITQDAWRRVDGYSTRFDFGDRPVAPLSRTPESTTWRTTFRIKAVDNLGLESAVATRTFDATTVAPTVYITSPLGRGSEMLSSQYEILEVTWSGRDPDGSRADLEPVGFQLKVIEIAPEEALSSQPAPVMRKLFHSLPPTGWSPIRRRNLLIPDSLAVGEPHEAGIPYDPLPSDDHYYETDWWPKASTPYTSTEVRVEGLPAHRFYAVAVRAVDEVGAVTPRDAFAISSDHSRGQVAKIDLWTW